MIFKKKKSNVKPETAAAQKREMGTLKNIERYLTSFAFLLAALILLFMMNLPGRPAGKRDGAVKGLEARLAALEEKVAGWCPDRAAREAKDLETGRGLEALTLRCDQLEGSMARRDGGVTRRMEKMDRDMEKLDRDMAKLDREIGALKTRYENLESKREAAPVPGKKKAVRKKGGAAKRPVKKKPVYHVIREGETFYSISKKYGISLDQLQRLNGLTSKSLIYPGQKLLISR